MVSLYHFHIQIFFKKKLNVFQELVSNFIETSVLTVD